ncbi:hypothetical protein [Streptomyces sp. NPDC058045]|uniref:hypothetical protein n=1 Tax=Streptomyces sp. NPDC058045 TaxID=3346311 RepID=UPI0036E17661
MRVAFAVVAVALIVAAVVVGRWARLDASGLSNYVALAVVCVPMGAGLAAWGVWAARSRVRGAPARLLASAGTVAAAIALGSLTVAAWAHTDPYGRYDRSFGGADRCLAGTPYASTRADVALGEKDNTLTVTPSSDGDATQKLHFVHASKGGDLRPADQQTRQIITSNGC